MPTASCQAAATDTQPHKNPDTVLSDPRRLQALQATGLMDTIAEEAFDRIVRIATEMLSAPVGLISLVDTDRQFFKAQCGLDGPFAERRETPLTHSFCQHVVTSGATLAVEDARRDGPAERLAAVRDLNVVAYLGVPVHAPDGQVIGSFCLIDGQPRQWSERETLVLTDLAKVVESEISLRQEASRRQLLVHELNHRVKNLFAVVGGMISLTANTAESPAAMASALRGRVNALARAHELIRPAISQETGGRSDVSLQTLVAGLIEPHLTHHNDHVTIKGPTLMLGANGSTNLALVLHELATNAAKYGALSIPDGRLEIVWTSTDDELSLNWTELDGPTVREAPLSAGFGTRLVQMTIGGQLGGRLITEWPKSGVRHRITAPLSRLSV